MVSDQDDHWSNRPWPYLIVVGLVGVFLVSFKIDWGWVTATWIQAIGSVLAILVAVGIVHADHLKHAQQEKKRKHRVARALMYEMFYALKYLVGGHSLLIDISKKTGSVPVSEIIQTYPSERKVYSALGADIGVLSGNAVDAAVNFDHYMQALVKDYDFQVGHINITSTIDPSTALKLANKISFAIERTTKMVECMAREAFEGNVPQEIKVMIRGLKTLVENKVNH